MTMTMIDRLLAKATELETQAKTLRLAATIFTEDVALTKRAATTRTLDQAIALRATQRNGHVVTAPVGGEEPEEPRSRGKRSSQLTPKERKLRDAKRIAILDIVRAYGKPMPTKELQAAAKEQGYSTHGIVGYVRSGVLKQHGKGKGATKYSIPAAE